MFSIAINVANRDEIEDVLLAVNERASKYAYTTYEDILDVVTAAREAIARRFPGLPATAVDGICYTATSGGEVPKSNKFERRLTVVTIEADSKGEWQLVGVKKEISVKKNPGPGTLILTDKFLESAVAAIRVNQMVPDRNKTTRQSKTSVLSRVVSIFTH